MRKHAWLLGLLVATATALPALAEPASDLNALGVSFTRFGMLEEAVVEFKKAIKQDPFFATGYYNLGVAYGKLRRYDKAIEAFKKTVELNPLALDAHINMAITYGRMERYDDAISEYLIALEIKPDSAIAHYNLACMYSAKTDLVSAITHLRKAIELNPVYLSVARVDQDLTNIRGADEFRRTILEYMKRYGAQG